MTVAADQRKGMGECMAHMTEVSTADTTKTVNIICDMIDDARERITSELSLGLDQQPSGVDGVFEPALHGERAGLVLGVDAGDTEPVFSRTDGRGNIVAVRGAEPVEPARVRYATEYEGDDEPGDEAALNRWLRPSSRCTH